MLLATRYAARARTQQGLGPALPGPDLTPPAAPGRGPTAAAAQPLPGPASRPAAYPESPLLAEDRLREDLARILRADGLRHGLDLKEG